MDIKKLVFIIGGIDIVLLAVCLFLYLGKDRTAPVSSFGENLASYEEGMDEELLLQGVTAMDDKLSLIHIYGVVVKKDGTTVEINVGDNEDDPVFFISDLLVHLAGEQMEKKAAKVIEGEALDLIVGNIPVKDKDKDAVTAGVLNILKESYGIEEQDFLSAELEIVPAGKAREAGFDRSMILAYGQDDRVCAYTSARAVLELSLIHI